jgi:hypothetical protein
VAAATAITLSWQRWHDHATGLARAVQEIRVLAQSCRFAKTGDLHDFFMPYSGLFQDFPNILGWGSA